MVKLTNHRQVLALISELKQVADRLTSNELEMFAHLKDKYRSVDAGDFDDKICLEVMLRNVSIRAGYGMDKSTVKNSQAIELMWISSLEQYLFLQGFIGVAVISLQFARTLFL